MFPFSSAPVEPAAFSCDLVAPTLFIWAEALGAFAVGTIIQIFLCAMIYNTPAAIKPYVGVALASVFAYMPKYFASYLDETFKITAVTWFIISSVTMTCFFKTVQAATGILLPKDAKVKNMVFKDMLDAYLAVPPMRFAKGKPLKPAKGELSGRLAQFGYRFASFSVVLSLLMSSFIASPTEEDTYFPLGVSTFARRQLGVYIQIWSIYLFLAIILDVGILVVILGGHSAEEAFDDPLTKSRSFREAWGARWNLVIHGYLKSCVYKPCRMIGLTALPATIISFVASGVLHEYMFMLHNASAYNMGEVCLFFIGMGFVMIAEEMIIGNLVPKSIVKLGAKMPSLLTAILLTLTSCLLFDPLYMASWRKAGMLPSMADLVVTVRCGYK